MKRHDRGPRLFYGWYVLVASFVILFVNSGGRFTIGVMVKPMTAEFDWSRGAVSSAIFLNMGVYALAVIITGRRRRRMAMVSVGGCSLNTVATDTGGLPSRTS